MRNVFLDTNVPIDLLLRRPFELEAVDSILALAEKGQVHLHVSESVVVTTLYVCKPPAANAAMAVLIVQRGHIDLFQPNCVASALLTIQGQRRRNPLPPCVTPQNGCIHHPRQKRFYTLRQPFVACSYS